MTTKKPAVQPDAPLSTRTALVLHLAVRCALGAAMLTYLSTRDSAGAALAGLFAFGGGFKLFNEVIGP